MAAIRWQWSARCTSLSLCVLGRGRVSRQRGTTHSAKTVPSSSYTVRTAPQEPSPSRSATVYVLCGSLPEPGHCIASIVRIATSLASPSGRPDGTVLSTSTKVRKNRDRPLFAGRAGDWSLWFSPNTRAKGQNSSPTPVGTDTGRKRGLPSPCDGNAAPRGRPRGGAAVPGRATCIPAVPPPAT